ncbi:hypothetical protein AB6805_29650 [Chitinophaga sp. RCC_12]|uniref:hypothetical protein n=1 Tax=Chitinophaga sp. RCC_12 TaxID=3239226 RepID=UPI0035241AFE
MLSSYELNLLLAVEQRLSFPALSLVKSIAFETGGTFNPAIKNKQSGATGLIQFLESTAEGIEKGLYLRLPHMTFQEQLGYVEKYFLQWKKTFPLPPREAFDVYALMLHPALFNKPDETVFAIQGTKRFDWNRAFDLDGNGTITKGEVKKKWTTATDKLITGSRIPITTVTANGFILISVAVFLTAMYYILNLPR